MAYFINRDAGRRKETVDEYETKGEALRMVPEYQMGEHGRAFYYVSSVACGNWKVETVALITAARALTAPIRYGATGDLPPLR
jgi:hypothetical protein